MKVRDAIGGALLLGLLACADARGGWQEVAPMPAPRWFHVAGVGGDGRIYAFGGYVWDEQARPRRQYGKGERSLVIYDPRRDEWVTGPPVPPFQFTIRYRAGEKKADGRVLHYEVDDIMSREVPHEIPCGGAGLAGRLYWFGGRGVVFFDPAAGAWDQPMGPTWHQTTRTTSGPTYLYSRKVAATATDRAGRLYLIGGIGLPMGDRSPKRRSRVLREVEVYDPAAHRWEEIAPMQQGRQHFSAAFGAEGRLYVFGGYGHTGMSTQEPGESYEEFIARSDREMGTAMLDSVEAWDPTTNEWSPRASMPVAIEASRAALGADGRIYVVGGSRSVSRVKGERIVQVYDPRTDSWSMGPKLRVERQGHAMVATPDGRIWVIGGTNRHNVFHPRMIVGGEPGSRGGPLASVEVLDTRPRP
jgi:N-acetylneuraminic acid mutarotase